MTTVIPAEETIERTLKAKDGSLSTLGSMTTDLNLALYEASKEGQHSVSFTHRWFIEEDYNNKTAWFDIIRLGKQLVAAGYAVHIKAGVITDDNYVVFNPSEVSSYMNREDEGEKPGVIHLLVSWGIGV